MVAAAACSCTKTPPAQQPAAKERISITASIVSPTRADIVAEKDGLDFVLKTKWAEDDQITVYNTTTGTSAQFTVTDIVAAGYVAIFSGEIETEGGQLYATLGCWNPGDAYDDDGNVIGYGPQTRDLGYFYTQEGNNNTGHLGNFAILYGSFTPENTAINFRHTMAFFKFTLTLPDGETIPAGSAEITLDVPTARYPRMNLTDGTYYPVYDEWSTGILRVTVGSIGSGAANVAGYMAVFPSDAGGRDLTLTLDVNDGQGSSTAYVKTLAAKTPRLVEAGKYYTVTEQMEFPPVPPLTPGGSVAPMTPQAF